jgi:transport and Golgi organization protein 2
VCTLSFQLADAGYALWFSRDEQRSRTPARPPAMSRHGDTRVLAPQDPDGGGTWLSVNAHGVALALLNDYASPAAGDDFDSRGTLVAALCGARGVREVAQQLGARALRRFRPFELAVFAPGQAVTRFAWNGRLLAREAGASGPFASSAVAHAEARAARRARFAELQASAEPDAHERFHREHAPARGPLSTCMHRADAKTVSLTRVRVTPGRVSMAYAAGSPCRSRFGAALELAGD